LLRNFRQIAQSRDEIYIVPEKVISWYNILRRLLLYYGMNNLRFMTFNLRHHADHWPERLPLVIEMLQQEDPDVVAFQEISLEIDQSGQILDKVNSIGNYPYQAIIEPKWSGHHREGIGFFSKIPLVENERLELPKGGRVAQRITILMDGTLVDLYNTHLHHLPPFSETVRLTQTRHLLNWMRLRSERGFASILAGDFNTTPSSKTITAILHEMDSSFNVFHGCEPESTFPTPLVKVPYGPSTIDYIFLSPGDFQVHQARLTGTSPSKTDADLYPSDHYGLLVELSLINSRKDVSHENR
jgi:endonuclease/exonuclease/phosphatase family metal-dependent hydrolase